MRFSVIAAAAAAFGALLSGSSQAATMDLSAVGPTTILPGSHVDFTFAASYSVSPPWTMHLAGDPEPGPIPFGDQTWYRGSRIDHSEWPVLLSVTATSSTGGGFATGASSSFLGGAFSMSFPDPGDFSVSAHSEFSARWSEDTHVDRAARSCFLFICGPWAYRTEFAGERSGGYGGSAYAGPIAVHVVPEPETWAMLATGLGILGARHARRAS